MDNYDYFKEENNQDDWVNLSEPAAFEAVETESVKESVLQPEKKTHRAVIAPVLTFQLVVTILILISIFLIKFFLPEFYFKVQKCFDTEMSRSMITDGDFSDFDYQQFFSSSNDEA